MGWSLTENCNNIRAQSLKMASLNSSILKPPYSESVHLTPILFPPPLMFTSSSIVTDLWTNQLQIGERNWGREKLELLERFSQERAQWEQRQREATSQQGKV